MAEFRTEDPSISKHALYQLSYRYLVKMMENFLILPQTSDQYWSTIVWFGGGAQNKSGKVAVLGDSFAMCQLRQKSAIILLSDYS